VHAKEGATPSDLMRLGKALAELHSRETRILSIHGLNEMLRGGYPRPCEPHPMVPAEDGEIDLGPRGRYRIPEPWRYCFARVHARGIGEQDLLTMLHENVAFGGEVTSMDAGHY
jgi:hypothetical protein